MRPAWRPVRPWSRRWEKCRPALDPAAGAAQALRRSGVGQVRVAGECTFDLEERFFSHRRDHGRTGRQAGLIALVPIAEGGR